MGITINDANLKFTSDLIKRKKTTSLILHHRGGNGDVLSIHNQHINQNKWAGCGYNFYIRLDGSIWKGRGWEYVGAHAGSNNGYNSKSIGICFEGNYETLSSMPEVQFKAGVELIKMAFQMYGSLEIKGHRDVYATACPGKYFPLDKFKTVTISPSPSTDTELINAVNKLYNKKIIKDVKYWSNIVSNKQIPGEWARQVVLGITGQKTIEEAVKLLASKSIISDQNYWLKNTQQGKSVDGSFMKKIIIEGVKIFNI